MSRDPLVEGAGEQLEYVFSKAQKLALDYFGQDEIQKDPTGYRITVLAIMKMLIKLMELKVILGEIPAPLAPGEATPHRTTIFPGKEAAKIPDIDIAVLEECPWQTYWKKDGETQPAKKGTAAWVKNPREFPGWEDAPTVLFELAKALDAVSDHKLVLGDMEYSFSGKDDVKDHFISRRPVKQESAKDNPGPHDRMSENLQKVKEAGKKLTEGGEAR